MTAKERCVEVLSGFVERGDRGELAEAQAAIIQYALGHSDLGSRSEAMVALRAALAARMQAKRLEPTQQAYFAVLDAMIDRTRDAVIDGKGEAMDG